MVQKQDNAVLEFGALLRKALKDSRITRGSLADYLQCSEDAINSWCCGRSRISPDRLSSICSLLSMKGSLSDSQVKQIYQKAIESYGFSPTWPPGNSATGKEITLCLSGSLSRRKELLALEIISGYLSKLNQQVFIFRCGNDIDTVLSCLDMVEGMVIGNVVMCGISLPPTIYTLILDKMNAHQIPVALVATDCPKEVVQSYRNAVAATWSNYELAYKATSSLIKAGHTRIGTVHLIKHEARLNGYLQALKDNNTTIDPTLILQQSTSGTPVASQSITDEKLMGQLESFLLQDNATAVFAPSELLTLAIPLLLVKHGKRLYDDISLCGLAYRGWIGQGLHLPLTYLSYPIEEVTHKALEILVRSSMMGELSPEERYVDVTRMAKRVDHGKTGSIKTIC